MVKKPILIDESVWVFRIIIRLGFRVITSVEMIVEFINKAALGEIG